VSESTPFENGRVSVTMKHNGKYEDPWIVFHGSVEKVKDDMIRAFGLGEGDVPFADRSLSDVLYEANKQSVAEYNAATALNGTVIKTKRGKGHALPDPGKTDEATVTDPKADEPEVNPLLAKIEAVPDVGALQKLWAENQAAFTEPDIMAAYKARGKALSAA
jgi:hypothetical protein